jgi:REP element-mobilizing transposase RayT
MARKPRIEVEGGLYHVFTRGNNRQLIFHDDDDYLKLLSSLEVQKERLPFYLYAYCLMPNHFHLLIERREDSISRIMHRLLTGYSQHHNRRYRKVGHVVQGRYKSILCQTDRYLAELVRYIHLNPIRAKLVAEPEDYRYSGHRSYLGLDRSGLVDVDPVLRHFGARKKQARERYMAFVRDGKGSDDQGEFYPSEEGRLLGNDEFVDEMIHRTGEVTTKANHANNARGRDLNLDAIIRATEKASGMGRDDFHGVVKRRSAVAVKEALILVGRQRGASFAVLSEATGLASSGVSRRHEAARMKMRKEGELSMLVRRIEKYLNES